MLPETYTDAISLHRQGRLFEAERLYRVVLEVDSNHFGALHHLGVVCAQQGRTDEAIGLIRRALTTNPIAAEAWCDLGVALESANSYSQAVSCYENAVALTPDYSAAIFNLGNALQALGRQEEAIVRFEQVLAVDPSHAEANNNLGASLLLVDRNQDAIACFKRALALKPDYAEANNNLGTILQKLAHHAEAIVQFERAIALKPGYTKAHNNLGNSLHALGRFAESTASQERARALQWADDREVVIRHFRNKHGHKPNLRNPTSFSEKLAYKMLYDRRPLLTLVADKVRVRDYVGERIGAQFLTTVYQVCRSASEIDWLKLPDRFVIKANHGTGLNLFVTDKNRINVADVASQLNRWIGVNYYFPTREWCYRDIQPAIIIEEMLSDGSGKSPLDWNFFTFDGRAAFLEVVVDRFTGLKQYLYDRNLKRLNVRHTHPSTAKDPVFPQEIETMFSLAETLGHDFDFVRVDLYNINGRIVFGEMTNYPLKKFLPPELDRLLGREWRLPFRYE